jgi:hypothetical protein
MASLGAGSGIECRARRAPARAVRQRVSGDALRQGRACVRRAGAALGRGRAASDLSAARPCEISAGADLAASDKRISSTLLGAGGAPGEAPPLLMHPRDAEARGLEGAKHVRAWNECGALPLKITDAVAPGVVASQKGAWLATSPTGNTISALVSADDRADLAQGEYFNDTAVGCRLSTPTTKKGRVRADTKQDEAAN